MATYQIDIMQTIAQAAVEASKQAAQYHGYGCR